MKLIERNLDKEEILKRIWYFPITAIVGPRLSGKTTLAHMLNPDIVSVLLLFLWQEGWYNTKRLLLTEYLL